MARRAGLLRGCWAAVTLVLVLVQVSVATPPLLPGASHIGVGVSGVSLQSTWRVLDLDFNTTWTAASGQSYLIPFGATVQAVAQDSMVADEGPFVFMSARGLQQHLASLTNTSFTSGMFAQSPQVQAMVQRTVGNSSVLAQVTQYYTQYHVTVEPRLSPTVAMALDKLPAAYNSSTAPIFKQFLDFYGTHFSASITLGGSCQLLAYVESCALQSLSRDGLGVQSRIMLGETTGGKAPLSLSGTVDTLVSQHSVVTTDLRGGTSTLDPRTQYAEWVESIAKTPALVQFSLTPLYELVPDSTLRMALSNATTAYLAASKGVAEQVGCTESTAWNYDPEASTACDGCCVQSPVLAQNTAVFTVPAWTCPRYLELVVNVDGNRQDGMGEYYVSATVSAPVACGASMMGGGTTAASVSNPSFVGQLSTKSGGDGYGWWYGGTTSRTFFSSDVSATTTYQIAVADDGYPGASGTMTLICH